MAQTFPIKLDDPDLLAKVDGLFYTLEEASQKYIKENAHGEINPFAMLSGLKDTVDAAALSASEPVKWLVERDADFALVPLENNDEDDTTIHAEVEIEDDQVAMLWKLTFGGA